MTPLRAGESVILASEFDYAGMIYSHVAVLPHLAEILKATPCSYSFTENGRSRMSDVYESIGLIRRLGNKQAAAHARHGDNWLESIFRKIKSRNELLHAAINGFPIGMIIYDTYMRQFGMPTIDLEDQRLHDIARAAARILYASVAFFDRYDVKAVFPDHLVYNFSGILAQLAWERGIPVYCYSFARTFYLYRIPQKRKEAPSIEVPYQHTFDRYPEDFARLDNQASRLDRARLALDAHLSGQKKDLIFGGYSAYDEREGVPKLPPATRPRILVMLHDFCDAPHVYGKFLFPDFTDWIEHLLDRAKDTGFEWLIKPHPNLQDKSRAHLNKANDEMVEQIRKRHPWVTILPPEYPNKQVIEDGVKALFTVRGSAGHEFAYLGIPVVNAGPNPHMRYAFNFHPETLEEYDTFIRNADQLDVQGTRSDIEEFYYMRYLSMIERFGADFSPIPPGGKAAIAERPTVESVREWQDTHGTDIREKARAYVKKAYQLHEQLARLS